MGIKVYENPNSVECIRCLECSRCAHVTVEIQPLQQIKPIKNTVTKKEAVLDEDDFD